VVIKVLFVVLILSTAALVGVGLAIHLRVKRHLREAKGDTHTVSAADSTPKADDDAGRS
jgi:hypothetical protein